MNLKNMILAARDSQPVAVDVPEWGTTVYLRELTVGDRQKLFARSERADQAPSRPVWLLIFTVCDEAGNLLFSEQDFAALSAKNATVVDRLAVRAAEISGLNVGAVDDAKNDSTATAN